MATLIVEDRDETALTSCGICLRCGEPSDLVKSHKFTWYPQWVSVLAVLGLLFCLPLALVVVLAGTRRKWLKVPLCDRHAGHWMWRLFLIPLFSLLGVIALVTLGAVLVSVVSAARPGRGAAADVDSITGLVCMAGGVLGLAWLVVVSFLQSGSIRPLEITDTGITLTNVSEVFVRSFRGGVRRPDLVVDDYVREHWRGTKPRPGAGGADRIREQEDGPEEPPTDAIREGD
jgi:hypothetical protein